MSFYERAKTVARKIDNPKVILFATELLASGIEEDKVINN